MEKKFIFSYRNDVYKKENKNKGFNLRMHTLIENTIKYTLEAGM